MVKKTRFIFERTYTMLSGVLLFRDWEDFGPKNLPEYFDKGYNIFCRKLEQFKILERPLTAEEEQELTFMMASLIHAKNARYE
jgi:hypothetical protein